MRSKLVNSRTYLLFWFIPILLLPFTWVNAVVQDAEVLGTIHGNGLLLVQNFPTLSFFYLFISISLLIPNTFIRTDNWKLLCFSCMLIYLSILAMLPRIIIGPTGLSESGLRDSSNYLSMYLITIRPPFYLAILATFFSVVLYFIANVKCQDLSIEGTKN
ncbi:MULTISPECIES: hypothetical protein [unclassified Enterococcus]|jgi:hypothetical protein|uniref:hypothetical protein n=1 Tax=unclassified Enterococcus TaxID=2608891 RepID=UPI003D2D7071